MNSQIITTLIYILALIVMLSLISVSVQGAGFDDPHQTPGVYSLDGVPMPGGGSQKSNNYDHKWLDNYLRDQHRIPVDGHIHGLSITKPESFQTNGKWNIQRVHRSKRFSRMSDRSLALDANGKPHIAYGETHLYYARYDEEWHIETVDDSWDVGMFASLALDSDGYPHISYYDRDPNGDLKYAYKDENGWHITTVDDDYWVGLFTSIALDANNHPHISYFDDTNGNLKYAYWDGSEWLIQTIDSEGVVGVWRTSLAIDASGHPHVSYLDYTNYNLKYAYWDGSDWNIQTVDNDDDVGGYNSLALDENGHPHISYWASTGNNLKYAYWDGSQWHIQTVDEDEDVGAWVSLALDASGHPHVSYLDYTNYNLKYAYWDGSDWNIQTADGNNISGYYTSLSLDESGNPHISHFGRPSGLGGWFSLRYAYHDGSDWQHEVVDDYLDMRGATSIAIEDNENLHIGFWRSDYSLGYTSWDGNQWVIWKIGRSGSVMREPGSGSFLDIDSEGRPHMIYHQQFLYEVGVMFPTFIYTWFDGMDWLQEEFTYSNIDDIRFPSSSSLVLDEFDSPHICVYVDRFKREGTRYLRTSSFMYRYRENTEWRVSNISRFLYFGWHNSLAIDSEGVPHISYTSQSGLEYSRLKENEWDIQTLDSDGFGAWNSHKVDSNNYPHISYYDTLNTALKYAHWNGNEWQIEIVDSIGRVGPFTSLDLDANDFPHISYYDETNGNLKYAYWDGNQWQIETVDSYRTVGWYTSLVLDAHGNPHISYYDVSFGDLKYATTSTVILVDDMNDSGLPGDFMLYQNYPNPFNPATTIRYTIPERRQVILKVYNTLGQEVAALVNEVIEPGLHEVLFDASSLPSGVYIYRIEAGEYVESKKLLFLK